MDIQGRSTNESLATVLTLVRAFASVQPQVHLEGHVGREGDFAEGAGVRLLSRVSPPVPFQALRPNECHGAVSAFEGLYSSVDLKEVMIGMLAKESCYGGD